MMQQAGSLRPYAAGCEIDARFGHYCTHPQTVRRRQKSKEKRLKPHS